MIKINGKEITFETFPNGETKMNEQVILESLTFVSQKETVANITFKYENDADLMKLMFVKKFLDKRFVLTKLKILYMPYSRMDRSVDGSAFTLRYVTDFLNYLSFDEVIVCEPHSEVTTNMLYDSKEHLTTPILLEKAMKELNWGEDDFIMFPDAGASKRYKGLFKADNIIVGKKSRDFETGRITGLELESKTPITSKSKRVIIADDLSSYGGTFVRSAEKLREFGFEKVYLVVSHAEDAILKGELFEHIDKVFTTNSILEVAINKNTSAIIHMINEKLTIEKMEEL